MCFLSFGLSLGNTVKTDCQRQANYGPNVPCWSQSVDKWKTVDYTARALCVCKIVPQTSQRYSANCQRHLKEGITDRQSIHTCTDEQTARKRIRSTTRGTSQLRVTTHTYWPNNELHLGALSTYTWCFNSMPSKAAAMLILEKSTQLEVNNVGLRVRQDWAT